VVIDNSSLYRMDPDVPLIVPEVNPDAIDGYTARNIIANPNCSTAQMVVALKPLHDKAKIKRVVVATYQSVSGAGKEGMDELFEQSRAIFVGDQVEPKKFTKQIAFNVIPHIDVFLDDGSTKEEWKMVAETKKILDPKVKVTATCVRVPVFIGHSEAINIEFENEIGRRSPGHPARGARRDAGRQARERRLRHPGRMRGRLCHLYQPRARGLDRRQRPVAVVRVGQPAQGCGAERGADRRTAGPPPPQEGLNGAPLMAQKGGAGKTCPTLFCVRGLVNALRHRGRRGGHRAGHSGRGVCGLLDHAGPHDLFGGHTTGVLRRHCRFNSGLLLHRGLSGGAGNHGFPLGGLRALLGAGGALIGGGYLLGGGLLGCLAGLRLGDGGIGLGRFNAGGGAGGFQRCASPRLASAIIDA
jgi:hypothetical protein